MQGKSILFFLTQEIVLYSRIRLKLLFLIAEVINGAYRDDSSLGLLMHDFACTNPNDMCYKILADKTRYFKEDNSFKEH